MWQYLQHLFQLILSPSRGWEDISASTPTYDQVQRRGYFPLVILTALFEFVRLIYVPDLTFLKALGSVIAIGGGLFVSLYATRLFLDITLMKFISEEISILKINILAVYLLGLDCLYRILADLLPAAMTFLSFLPLISLLVLFKSTPYIGVPEDHTINYLVITFIGVVVIPLAICALLLLII